MYKNNPSKRSMPRIHIYTLLQGDVGIDAVRFADLPRRDVTVSQLLAGFLIGEGHQFYLSLLGELNFR